MSESDKANFVAQVTSAYGHLYDLVYLRTHPLIDLLIPDPVLPRKGRAWQLHHMLLDVIEELEPGPQVPVLSRQWRRHRLMVLRYVKALDPDSVAQQLTVSRRHFYREHKIAIASIAGILWERHMTHESRPVPGGDAVAKRAPPDQMELLRLEAARLAQADRYARAADVIESVLPLLGEMLNQRGLTVELALPDSLPDVSVDQGLLRQMLLGMLGYLIERAEQATVRIVARVEETAVSLLMRVEPIESIHPTRPGETEVQLAAFEEIAALSNAAIQPARAGASIVGFDVQLPFTERAVLVVDDNEDVQELFRRYLSPHHYRVITAQTARKALDLARRLQPFVITLDLMMPEQDGWDVLQALLNQPDTQQIPVIVCSVLKQKALALSLGATAFLEKPITEQTLLTALEALEQD